MNKRITLISMLDIETINTISKLVKDMDICKVPYGIDNFKRKELDTLPFHFTIYAWGKEYQEEVIFTLQNMKFQKVKVKVDSVRVMKGKEESYILYLSIEENEQLKKMQTILYQKFKIEKYNPESFHFHITLHIDKDYDRILKDKEIVERRFKPFEIALDKLGLFEIYPAKLEKEIIF